MTLNKYQQLKGIVDKAGQLSNIGALDVSYTDCQNEWSLAVTYNKRHKQLQAGDVVREFEAMDETTRELVRYHISAENKKTRLQHFAISIALMHCLTYQKIKQLLDEL